MSSMSMLGNMDTLEFLTIQRPIRVMEIRADGEEDQAASLLLVPGDRCSILGLWIGPEDQEGAIIESTRQPGTHYHADSRLLRNALRSPVQVNNRRKRRTGTLVRSTGAPDPETC